MAVFMSLVLVLLSTFTAMAENPTEIDDYLNTTYAEAINLTVHLNLMMREDILCLYQNQVFPLKPIQAQSLKAVHSIH